MINTDEYKGHTPADEWDEIVWATGYKSIFLNTGEKWLDGEHTSEGHATDLDRRLMASAPLLLAEVERLREGIENILKNHNFPFILSGLKRELKELIE